MTPATPATIVVDGLGLAQAIRRELSEAVAKHVAAGRRPPCLAVVVGNDPASQSYIKGKRRACERIGMASVEHDLAADASEDDVLALVAELNADDAIDGILTQLPDHDATIVVSHLGLLGDCRSTVERDSYIAFFNPIPD